MKLESAELRVVKLPLKFRFETSFGAQTERTIPVLILRAGGMEGYAEGVMDSDLPLYREEIVATALPVVRDALLPRVIGQELANPEMLAAKFAPFRGHRMAKALVEMAFWDLWAKQLDVPLWQLLGGVRDRVAVGVSLGIQSSIEATVDAVERHVTQGYKRIKLKIKPGWDVKPIGAVRAAFPDIALTVDANSAYTLADLATLRELDSYQLDYIEQPLAWDDMHDHANLQAHLRTPICLDESIASATDARKALEIRAGRVINLKVGRVGGHGEARRVHDVAQSFGIPVWCGGMLESGIGRAHNIHLSTLANFAKPGDTSSSSRYWTTDLINEPLETENGMMSVPTGPGIGVTLNRPFLEQVSLSVEEFWS